MSWICLILLSVGLSLTSDQRNQIFLCACVYCKLWGSVVLHINPWKAGLCSYWVYRALVPLHGLPLCRWLVVVPKCCHFAIIPLRADSGISQTDLLLPWSNSVSTWLNQRKAYFTALILFSQTQDMNSKIIDLMPDFSIHLLYFCYWLALPKIGKILSSQDRYCSHILKC